jgi:hypothetical protein
VIGTFGESTQAWFKFFVAVGSTYDLVVASETPFGGGTEVMTGFCDDAFARIITPSGSVRFTYMGATGTAHVGVYGSPGFGFTLRMDLVD